jgi:hypothetical protein
MAGRVVFFDIGETLGTARLSFPGQPFRIEDIRIEGLDVFPFVPDLLSRLSADGVRLGIISNTPQAETAGSMQAVLEAAQILDFFSEELLIYSSVIGLQKDAPEIFSRAVELAGLADQPQNCVFVGEDADERGYALEAGLRVAPHPLLVEDILAGNRLRFARLTAPAEHVAAEWRRQLRLMPVVPLRLTGAAANTLYCIASMPTIRRLDDIGFEVDRLGAVDAPLTCELYLMRDDRNRLSGFMTEEGQSSKFFLNDGESDWVVSSTHEGLLVALPHRKSIDDYHLDGAHGHNAKLLADLSLLEPFGTTDESRLAAFVIAATVPANLTTEEAELLRETITSERIRHHVERFSGVLDVDSEGKVNNRHTRSRQMPRVINALIESLRSIGDGALRVFPQRFTFSGLECFNVVAELPGASQEQVLITAHLDATAQSSHAPGRYEPQTDPAPGADDDGSGLAAVLTVAEALQQLYATQRPPRTVRFVLFNAEEQGLVGSGVYAREAAVTDAPIVGVFQMDMIGFNSDDNLKFELHIGFADNPEVEQRSRILADRIDEAREALRSKLPVPEIIHTPDPGDQRSDHSSFHARGYAACLASEDLFGPTGGQNQDADGNPKYHQETDTFVDYNYASQIAQVVAGAAVVTLKS